MPHFSIYTQQPLKRLQRLKLLIFQRDHFKFDNGFRFDSRQSHSLPFYSKCLQSPIEKQHLYIRRVQAHRTNICCSFHSMGFRRLWSKDDHYRVLGVKEDASYLDIRTAFLKKSKECHPDLNPTDPNSQKKFVRVNEAYSVLSQSSSKRDYDKNSPQQHSSGPYGRRQHKYRSRPKSEYQPPHNFNWDQHYESGKTKMQTDVAFTIGIVIFGIYLVFSNFKKIQDSFVLPSESAMKVSASSAKPTGPEHFPKNFRFIKKKPRDKLVKEKESMSPVMDHTINDEINKNNKLDVKEKIEMETVCQLVGDQYIFMRRKKWQGKKEEKE